METTRRPARRASTATSKTEVVELFRTSGKTTGAVAARFESTISAPSNTRGDPPQTPMRHDALYTQGLQEAGASSFDSVAILQIEPADGEIASLGRMVEAGVNALADNSDAPA